MVGSLHPDEDGTKDATYGRTNGQANVGEQMTEEGMFVCLSNQDKSRLYLAGHCARYRASSEFRFW